MPVIVLAAEQEIYKQYSDGGACNDHDAVAKEEEAKHIIDSAGPDTAHDEVELDDDGTEGKDANEKHGGNGTEVACAGRNLTWYLISAYRRGNCLDNVGCVSTTSTNTKSRDLLWNLQAA